MTLINNGNITVNIYNTQSEEMQRPTAGDITQPPEPLRDVVKGKPQPWRPKKKKAVQLAKALHELGYGKKANRVWWCSDELGFSIDPKTGKKKLQTATFCRERLCMMCNWRKSIKMFYQLSRVLDVAQEENPDMQLIFLTLTVKNCSGEELDATIDAMFDGWRRLTEHRRVRSHIAGWFRALEVTYNAETDSYHPHFHAILAVDKSYFFNSAAYLHTHDWVHIWRVSCRIDYEPVCDVRAVRKQSSERRHKHVAELAKYTVKDADIIHEDAEVTKRVVDVLGTALRNRRLHAYGGLLKIIAKRLKAEEPGAGDLIHIDDDAQIREDVAEALTVYKWDFGLANYFRRA